MQNTIIHIQDTQRRCYFASIVAVVIRLHLNKQTLKGNVYINLKQSCKNNTFSVSFR